MVPLSIPGLALRIAARGDAVRACHFRAPTAIQFPHLCPNVMANFQPPQSPTLTGAATCGVGLTLQCHNSRFYVAEVLPICSGFFEHSIQPGDEIQKVGNLDVRGFTLDQLDRALLGEAGTFVSVLLQRHSQLLETTLLRIEQPRATSAMFLPSPLSPIRDGADKVVQAIRGFDADNAHLRTSLKTFESQLSGACLLALNILRSSSSV